MKLRTRTAPAAALLAALTACAPDATVVQQPAAAPSAPPVRPAEGLPRKPLPPIPLIDYAKPVRSGEARLPDQTAEDWVTYAEHVVAVTAVEERLPRPSRKQLRLSASGYTREVRLRVDQVAWSSPTAPQPAPAQLTVPAWGVRFEDGDVDRPRPTGHPDVPRLELGHSYLIALAWEDARCSEGDRKQPAQWDSLGSDSIIPFDDGVIGKGDMGGRMQDPVLAKAAALARPFPSLEDRMLGRGLADLRVALEAAKAGTRQRYGPGPAPCP